MANDRALDAGTDAARGFSYAIKDEDRFGTVAKPEKKEEGGARGAGLSCAILSLGDERVPKALKQGFDRRGGISLSKCIITGDPTREQLENFFKGSPDWIYFGGHFAPGQGLYDDKVYTLITFQDDAVEIQYYNEKGLKEKFRLPKRDGSFNLHKNCKLVLWGGCDIGSKPEIIKSLKSLFGTRHVLLGWKGSFGPEMVEKLLKYKVHNGGSFFDRISKIDPGNIDLIREKWVETYRDLHSWLYTENDKKWHWQPNASMLRKLYVIDQNNTPWQISDNGVIYKR